MRIPPRSRRRVWDVRFLDKSTTRLEIQARAVQVSKGVAPVAKRLRRRARPVLCSKRSRYHTNQGGDKQMKLKVLITIALVAVASGVLVIQAPSSATINYCALLP